MSEPREEQPTTRSTEESSLEAIVRPVLRAHGVELFDLLLRREPAGWVLRVVIDVLDEPGQPISVTVDQCADVSRDVSAALDVADLVEHEYVLEVSSPGVERPLRTLRDFERFAGKLARLWLAGSAGTKASVLQARLRGIRDQAVMLETEGGATREVAFAGIRKAQLVFESPAQPKDKARNLKRRSKDRR